MLQKKGDLSKCDNWRDITLLSVLGKVFSIVLLNCLWRAVDTCLRDQQAEFRRGRSCTEKIFVLRQVIGQSLEYQQRISLNFIDFVKAFDLVHRETLWKISRAYGLPSRFVDIFCNLYQGSPCCVQMEEGITDLFAIATIVRQGCVLSPMLFFLSSTLSPTTPSTAYTLAYLG